MAAAFDPVPSYRNFAITGADIHLPEDAAFVLAKDYEDLRFAVPRPTDGLNFDGSRRGEDVVEGFVAGYGIGQNFGCAPGKSPFGQMLPAGKGDWVQFRFPLQTALDHPCLCVRYLNPSEESSVYHLSTGEVLTLPSSKIPALAYLPLNGAMKAGDQILELTAQGCGSAKLDCLVLCSQEDREQISIQIRESGAHPEIVSNLEEQYLLLQYPHIQEWYGIAWDYPDMELREIENDELDIFLRDTVQDHVRSVLRGNGKGHFTNLFLRPIPMQPGETKVIYGVVCSGETRETVEKLCRSVRSKWNTFDAVWDEASEAMKPVGALPEGTPFALGQQLMRAVLSTNVVYPVYTRGQYIRHNTPGRWWDSLYTWDSGFIGMGLTQFSVRRGFECLRAYLTAPGDDEAAFIHHGSMVPTQFYLYAELWNRTCNLDLARYCYPRLKQYYRFISGQAGGSTTANLKSGLLRPWDYFYNSGGWDDYPPQKTVHAEHLEAVCTPVITTAHVIRCAKILAQTAQMLGLDEEATELLADAQRMKANLQTYSWDEESGYFGYVLHDADGNPKESSGTPSV